MSSHDQGSPVTRTQTNQLRPHTRTENLCSRNATPTLSDRVRKSGWARKACLECHRRKVKCDMTTKNKCTSCEKLNVPCSVNEYRRRRNKEKRSKIDRLESGIERMENVFERLGLMRPGNYQPGTPISYAQSPYVGDLSALHTQDGADVTWDTMSGSGSENSKPDMNQPSMCSPSSVDRGKAPSVAEGDGYAFLRNLACPRSLVDSTRYMDATTPSVHRGSQDRINYMLGGEGSNSFSPMPSFQVPDHYQPFDDVNTSNTPYPLPGIGETMVLFLEFIENFNSICPLFQPLSLLSICDEDNIVSPDQADRWACINVVLALAHTMRSKGSDIRPSNHKLSWMYMENALHVADSLCNGPPTLWAAQALLGMTIFLLGTLNSEPCDRLIASALRIIHLLLTEDPENIPIDWEENLQHRRMVFWIAYCLDRDICLRFGRSLGQSDEVTDIEFSPGLSTHHCNIPSENEQPGFDVFKSYCELSVIKGKVYKFLCSATTSKQPISDLAGSVAMLDRTLREWKASVPQRYRPDVEEAPSFPDSKVAIPLLSLHFSYFNCLLSVHRVIVSNGPSINMELARSYSSGLLSEDIALLSGISCQNAARASIKLMKHMPGDNPSIAGILLHYLVVATTTLSKNIIHNPRLASGTWDINLIKQVERFLSSVVLTTPNEGMHRVVKHCAEHRCLAESAVSRVKALSVG